VTEVSCSPPLKSSIGIKDVPARFILTIHGRAHSAHDQRIPGPSPGHTRSLYIHMFTSAARLVYWRPSDVWIACDSCTYETLGGHLKRAGESPSS
jgi:hypothetical protein